MPFHLLVAPQFGRLFTDPIVSVRAVGDAISLYPTLPNHEEFQKVRKRVCGALLIATGWAHGSAV